MDFDLGIGAVTDKAINGHFCPLTLSIYETEANRTGSLGIKPVVQGDAIEPGDPIEDLRAEMEAAGAGVSDHQFLSHLVGFHEHDHFLRFISSDLGLLIHCCALVQYAATTTIIRAMSSLGRRAGLKEICAATPSITPIVVAYIRATKIMGVLWYGNLAISQKEACEDINWLISLLGGDPKTVIPDDDDAPASCGIGMLHMLEASAVLGEETFLTMFQLPPERVDTLLRRNDRDYAIYFMLRDWALKSFGAPILALFGIRMTLDACVTGLLYKKQDGSLPYHNFHPGYRLNEFGAIFAAMFPNGHADIPHDVSILHFARYPTLSAIYRDVSDAAATVCNCPMFAFESANPRISCFDDFSAKISVNDDFGIGAFIKTKGMPTISYWIESHHRLRAKRLKHPALFIFPNVWGANFEVNPHDFEDPCATFVLLDGIGILSTSLLRVVDLDQNIVAARLASIMNAVGLRFRIEVISRVLDGYSLSRAIASVADRFVWAVPGGVLRDKFEEIMKASIEHLFVLAANLA